MLNKVQIIGRLGQNPELKYSQSGVAMTNLNVATDESYTDRDGNRVDRAEWHRVVVFQRQAENCANFLAKGSLVYVEGSLTTRKWTDQQGVDRYTTEIRAQRIQFLDRKGDRQEGGGSGGGYAPRQNNGGNNYSNNQNNYSNNNNRIDDDLGPAFPSEASSMDDVPF